MGYPCKKLQTLPQWALLACFLCLYPPLFCLLSLTSPPLLALQTVLYPIFWLSPCSYPLSLGLPLMLFLACVSRSLWQKNRQGFPPMGRSVAVLLAVPLSSSTLIPFLVAPYVLLFPVFSCAPSSDVHFPFLFVFSQLRPWFLCLLTSFLGVTWSSSLSTCHFPPAPFLSGLPLILLFLCYTLSLIQWPSSWIHNLPVPW